MQERIKIVKCSNKSLWYNLHINEEFAVIKKEIQIDATVYWVRDRQGYTNWVLEQDCVVI